MTELGLPHGTLTQYKRYRCRCAMCRAANTAWQREYMASHPEQREKKRRKARKGSPRRGPVHGARSGLNWHKTHKSALCQSCESFKLAMTMVREAQRLERLAPCGTPAAIRRHYRKGEPIDEMCRVAFNLMESNRRKLSRRAAKK